MPFQFTPTIKPFVAASLLDSLTTPRPEARRPNFFYSQGALVTNRGTRYIAIQSGVSGSGQGPSVTSGTQNDGTVVWLAQGPDIGAGRSINSNLYIGIGKQTEWDDPSTPPEPTISPEGMDQVLEDVTAFLRLNANNVRLGIKTNAWEAGIVYSQYDPEIDQSEYTTPNYVIVDQTQIYKCLDNNNGAPSTVAPFGTGSAVIELGDGYIWKHVGTVANQDLFLFGTSTFSPIPLSGGVNESVTGAISTFTDLVTAPTPFDEGDSIHTLVIGDGTGATAAPRVSILGGQMSIVGMFASAEGRDYTDAFAVAYNQDAPGSGAELEVNLDGDSIDSITVEASGEEYADATVIIIGDGSGAEATPIVSGDQIAAVNVDAGGSGYTWARAFVIPGTQGAVARAVMAPAGGHGYNLASELNASTILISTTLSSSLNNYVPTESGSIDGSFRQISLVSSIGEQPNSARNAEAYLGPAHPNYNGSSNLDKYQLGTGFVLYVNNIVSIVHTAQQEETIKISITL